MRVLPPSGRLLIAITIGLTSIPAVTAEGIEHQGTKASMRTVMLLPAELQRDVVVLEPRRWKSFWRPLEMPPFSVAKLKTSFSPYERSKVGEGHVWNDSLYAGQRYSFNLKEGRLDSWHVDCASGTPARPAAVMDGKSVKAPASHGRKVLQCVFTLPGGEAWTLEVSTAIPPPLMSHSLEPAGIGRLSDGKHDFAFVPEYRAEGLIPVSGVAGYVIATEGMPVAAIESLPPGRLIVTTKSDPARRSLFAAITAAVLLEPEAEDV